MWLSLFKVWGFGAVGFVDCCLVEDVSVRLRSYQKFCQGLAFGSALLRPGRLCTFTVWHCRL